MADIPNEKKKKPHTCLGYTLKEKLGGGGFAWARVGVRKHKTQDDEIVAIKFIKYEKKDQKLAKSQETGKLVQVDPETGKPLPRISMYMKRSLEEINTELVSLQSIKHPNVVRLLKYKLNHSYQFAGGNSHNCIAMVLELCAHGELFDLVYHGSALDEMTARTFFRQICSGLACLHQHKIAHRDIKPQNLLLTKDFTVKIADLGSAKRWKNKALMKTCKVGTIGFQAPELKHGRNYTFKCDVFSLAVTLFVLLTKTMPCKEQATLEDDFYVLIAAKKYDRYWRTFAQGGFHFSDTLKDLFQKMLAYQPVERIGIEDIRTREDSVIEGVVNHPWFKEAVHPKEELRRILKQKMKIARSKRDKIRNPNTIDSERFRSAGKELPELPILPEAREFFAMQLDETDKIPKTESRPEMQAHPVVLLDYVAQMMDVDDYRTKVVKGDGPAHYILESRLLTGGGEDEEEEKIEIELRGYQNDDEKQRLYYVDLRVREGHGHPATIKLVDTVFDHLGAPRDES